LQRFQRRISHGCGLFDIIKNALDRTLLKLHSKIF